MITIRRADPRDPVVADLIDRHAAHGDAHYPADSNHHLTAQQHEAEGTALFVAVEGVRGLGLAGLKALDPPVAELKSMHVIDAARGQGVGRLLLEHVLGVARDSGVQWLCLETGSRDASAAARRLYERHGFEYCAPYPPYKPDPESVFMKRAV